MTASSHGPARNRVVTVTARFPRIERAAYTWHHCQSGETTGLCRVGEHDLDHRPLVTSHPGPDAAWSGTQHYACERAIRPVAVGRRNWLFAGSQRGGRMGAAVSS